MGVGLFIACMHATTTLCKTSLLSFLLHCLSCISQDKQQQNMPRTLLYNELINGRLFMRSVCSCAQCAYLIVSTAHLRGVHVVGEKLFQVSGEVPHSLEWEEYGLRIQVPKGATSTPCDIAIKAIVAGQFEFPEGTDLVSAVYAISVSKKLTQPVILEMQHCVAISSEEQGQFLSFVMAKCNQPDLPYKFKLLDGGRFPPQSDYGKISCRHFSLTATARHMHSTCQPAGLSKTISACLHLLIYTPDVNVSLQELACFSPWTKIQNTLKKSYPDILQVLHTCLHAYVDKTAMCFYYFHGYMEQPSSYMYLGK